MVLIYPLISLDTFLTRNNVPLRRVWPELSDKVPIIIVWSIKGINSILKKKKKTP